MNKQNDKWYRIIGIPVISLVSNIIFYYDMNERHGFSFLKDLLYTLVTVWIIWESNRRVIFYTRQKFSSFADSKKRIKHTIAGVIIVTCLIMILISVFYDVTKWWGYKYHLKNYVYNNFAALTYAIIVGGIYEATYYFSKWRNKEVEAAMLKKENLQSQLDSLKQQVNPHFLFNSLNTLSSLMRKDVGQAERFLDELSKVYRYLLHNNEDSLITLGTELEFIYSYFHLLTTRYGDAIQLHVKLDDVLTTFALPPLTLQLLIENAVKHNIVEKTTPLTITIQSAENLTLTVTNNLQRKILNIPSNKVGLSNIASKYQLLGGYSIAIIETENEFTVKVPLLKINLYENPDC